MIMFGVQYSLLFDSPCAFFSLWYHSGWWKCLRWKTAGTIFMYAMNPWLIVCSSVELTRAFGILEGHVDEFDTHIDWSMKWEEIPMPC